MHFPIEDKLILKNQLNGEENKSIYMKTTVLKYDKFWDRFL